MDQAASSTNNSVRGSIISMADEDLEQARQRLLDHIEEDSCKCETSAS